MKRMTYAVICVTLCLAPCLLSGQTAQTVQLPRSLQNAQLFAIEGSSTQNTTQSTTQSTTQASPAASSAFAPRTSIYTPPAPETDGRTLYRWSLLALVAGNVADAASSWHHEEANPLLATPGSNFNVESLVIKSSLVGGTFFIEQWALRHNSRLYKPFAWMNMAIGGGLGAVAAYNYRIQ